MSQDRPNRRHSAVCPTLEVLESRALPSAAPLDLAAVNAQTWSNRLFLLEVGPVAVANAYSAGWKAVLQADTNAALQESHEGLSQVQDFLQATTTERDQALAGLTAQAAAGDAAAAAALGPFGSYFAQATLAVQSLAAQIAYNQALAAVDLVFLGTLPDVSAIRPTFSQVSVAPTEPKIGTAPAVPTAPTSVQDASVVPTLSASLLQHLREILAVGRQKGNRSDWFIKVGDSITATAQFLTELGSPFYEAFNSAVVGDFTYLAATLDYFRYPKESNLSDGNSFTRTSTAATPGWTTNQVLTALPGEIAQVKPAVALIMIGTNDLYAFRDAAQFRAHLTAIVDEAAKAGVIPVLSTIPDHLYVPGGAAIFNQVIAEVATATNVPLMNYWRALQTLPNQGISGDLIHPSADPQGTGLFTAQGLQYGFNVRNLVALQTLDLLRREVLT